MVLPGRSRSDLLFALRRRSSVCGTGEEATAAAAEEEEEEEEEGWRAGVPVRERVGVRRRTSIGARSRGMIPRSRSIE
jgi:hypothetical protein